MSIEKRPRIGKSRLWWALNTLLKGAGYGVNPTEIIPGTLSATCVVIANDAKSEIKTWATILQNAGYPVWVCDGVDDDVEINAAIIHLITNPPYGGTVDHSSGQFYIGSPVYLIASTIRLAGQGRKTIYKAAAGLNDDIIKVDTGAARYGLILENFVVDGNKANQASGSGICITGSCSMQIIGLQIYNCKEDGIYGDGAVASTSTPTITRCSISQNDGNNIRLKQIYTYLITNNPYIGTSGLHCIFLDDIGGEGTISLNCIDQAGRAGIYIYHQSRLTIENNHYIGACGWAGIMTADGGSSKASWDMLIEGNMIWINGASLYPQGIRLDGYTKRVTINGNRIGNYSPHTTQEHAIYMSSHADGVYIDDNDLQGNSVGAISNAGASDVKYGTNPGFVTKNHGSSTGTGAEQTIAHGLDFTPTKEQVILWDIDESAYPYHSDDPDATNIYVTATNGKNWGWKAEN